MAADGCFGARSCAVHRARVISLHPLGVITSVGQRGGEGN